MKFRRFLCALLCGAATVHAEPLRVLTTIKPLQLIVLAVTGGDSSVQVDALLPAQASPHDYQLRPSDRQKLANADIVFWVGPQLELFLERALANAKVAEALAPHESQEHDAADGHDGHIWMDPLAGAELAERVATRLGALRPAQATSWHANAAALRQRLMRLDAELRAALPSRRAGYIVSHDAFAPFERRYGLQHEATLSDGEERPPGPRRLAEIERSIAQGKVTCALLEPHYDRKLMATLVAGTAVKSVTVDTLAENSASDGRGLEAFYRGLGRAFADCLRRER